MEADAPPAQVELAGGVPSWDLAGLPAADWDEGDERVDPLRDHIDLAAPLARLTFDRPSPPA